MKIITETERLIIRELVPTDMDVMLELHSDPDVHVYLGNEIIISQERIMEVIESIRQQYIDFGVGRWAMINKETKEFIGWTGLQFVRQETNNHRHFYDIGYRLKKRFWGQGYATESAIASIDYAFGKLNITEIYARADARNEASDNVLKKAGIEFIETFDYEGIKHNWYKLEKSNL